MGIGPTISFSNRLSLRELDAELWRLYFGFVKGLLMMLSSLIYFPLVCILFFTQHAAYGAGKFAAWITEWNPEKPGAFDLTVEGD